MLSRLAAIFAWCRRPAVAVPCVIVLASAVYACLTLYTSTPQPALGKELFPTVQKKRFAAPDLDGGVAWLNTDKPLTLADLKGRIVVLDFWTLCCINCIHTLPDLAKLEARYPGVLVVVGVHTPKFDNEKKSSSILKAILRYEITHPVINDADRKIWNSYGVRSWPTLGLIDPEGNIVRGYAGEGNYEQLDKDIAALIKEFKGKGLKEDVIEFKLAKEKDNLPIYFPGKVLADAKSGRLFIADSTNHRVVITTLEGKKIAIAGNGKEGYKDGAFAEARFSDPQGMALDGDTLYVADRKNHTLRTLDLKALTVTTLAGVGEQSHIRKGGPGVKTGLNSPWDLLLFQKKLYIAMAGHHQIWRYDFASKRVEPYAGDGREDIGDGTLKLSHFAQPSGLATDGEWLFVADSEISAIRAVTLPGAKVSDKVVTIVGEGLFEFGDKNGVGNQVRLQHALGVVHLNGKLYVADTYNDKIKVIDPRKRACDTFYGDSSVLGEPGGLSIADGKMYIADTNNHRIQIVDMTTKAVSTLKLQDVDPVPRFVAAKKEAK